LSVLEDTTVDLFTPQDNDEVKTGMTKYGVLITEQDEDNDPDSSR